MADFDKFLLWEAKSRDTIDFKKIYVDIAGDLVAGLLLSQLIYWHLPDDKSKTKLRVKKGGHLWIAKGRKDWWEEIRITPKQFDRASNILTEKGIIEKTYYRFDGLRTIHIRLEYDRFMELWETQLEPPAIDQRGNPQLTKGETRSYPLGKPAIDQRVRPLTKNTTETTTDINGSSKNSTAQNPNDLADSIATICKVDIVTASPKTIGAIKTLTIALNGKSVIPDNINLFSVWWYDNTWQGKKGQPPTPALIGDNWGRFEESLSKPATRYDPGLTDAEKARLAELVAEHNTN